MVRSPCCSKEGLNRGAWTAREDKILIAYINAHGEGRWRNLPKKAGLKRCGKSCRLRWLNYLRPDIKRGNISEDEEELIIRLHKLLGNRWSLIAGRLPGRTDNEIKNYWNTILGKKVQHSNPTQLEIQKHLINHRKKIESNSAENTEEKIPRSKFETHVVRTKARRCTTLFVSPPQARLAVQNPSQLQNHPTRPSITPEEDEDSSVLLDFDFRKLGVSEFFDSDMLQLSDVGENISYNKCNKLYSCSTDQPLFFTEKMLDEWIADECLQFIACEHQPLDSYLGPDAEAN